MSTEPIKVTFTNAIITSKSPYGAPEWWSWDYPGMRRRASSCAAPQIPVNSTRNRGVHVGPNASSSSGHCSNLHFHHKHRCNHKPDGTRTSIPKAAPFNVMTILLIFAILSFMISKGTLFIKTHFLSKTRELYYFQDGSKRISSSDRVFSGITATSKTRTFAVVINTYKRPDSLRNALIHYAQKCGISTDVSQVFVVWADQNAEPPMIDDILPGASKRKVGNLRSSSSSSEDEHAVLTVGDTQSLSTKLNERTSFPTIEFVRVTVDSLNSRFLPIENLETKAVFMVDDDIRVDCPSLQAGFEAWKHHPNAMVGFYPRLAALSSSKNDGSSTQEESKVNRIYHTWPMVFAQHKFNMILTKASFFHRKYLDMYHDDERNPKEVLEYVDENKNCEDIAMAFLVARNTKKSVEIDMETSKHCRDCPVFTKGKIRDDGLFSGISTGGGSISPKGHMDRRSICLDVITTIYKKRGWEYPLADFDLGDQSWTPHLFWWQYTPSNPFEWFSLGNLL